EHGLQRRSLHDGVAPGKWEPWRTEPGDFFELMGSARGLSWSRRDCSWIRPLGLDSRRKDFRRPGNLITWFRDDSEATASQDGPSRRGGELTHGSHKTKNCKRVEA